VSGKKLKQTGLFISPKPLFQGENADFLLSLSDIFGFQPAATPVAQTAIPNTFSKRVLTKIIIKLIHSY